MKGRFRTNILRIIGLIFCTVPPVAATLLYFPIWQERGAADSLCGFTLLLILLSLLPLIKTLRRIFRSPSSHTLWFIAFLVFFLLSKIADEVTVISFAGFIGNLIGAALFYLAKRGDGLGNEE